MPTYQYICDTDDKGCGEIIETSCLFAEREANQPKQCPNCKKRKPIHQVFGTPYLSIPKTIGSLSDKNSSKLSSDEKHHINSKNNDYREKGTNWEGTAEGMIRHDRKE